MFHFKALLWESIIFLLPPPYLKSYPIAILLHDHCAIYALQPTLLLYAIHHRILVMTVSCKGQLGRLTRTPMFCRTVLPKFILTLTLVLLARRAVLS